MANDNILAGLEGFFSGFESGFVPFQQLKAKTELESALKKKDQQSELQNQFKLKDYENKLAIDREQSKDYMTMDEVPDSVKKKVKADSRGRVRADIVKAEIGADSKAISPYADMRGTQFQFTNLPSHAPANTPAAQASSIQLAARQLRGLVANPGEYQRLGLAKGDLARMVLRAAPQEEVLKEAGYSNTLIQDLNKVRQKLDSDPDSIDQPKLRKALYDISKELEASSRPLIERSLDEQEIYQKPKDPQGWAKVRALELGEKFPDQPFNEGTGPSGLFQTNGQSGWTPDQEKRYQELLAKKNAGLFK